MARFTAILLAYEQMLHVIAGILIDVIPSSLKNGLIKGLVPFRATSFTALRTADLRAVDEEGAVIISSSLTAIFLVKSAHFSLARAHSASFDSVVMSVDSSEDSNC